MSLYNLINGANPATFLVLPMLGKHPEKYPRFRDCFVDEGCIVVFTRTGGANRAEYSEGIEEMRKMPGFVKDYDDNYDSTYAYWYFNVPEKWKADFDKIMSGRAGEISQEYQDHVCAMYPKIEDKLRELFSKLKENAEAQKQ